ncbi:thioredoxin-like domain-containing protein [Winogradskyella sp. SYSU M77433]|uniref:TlpA family protein disulfide reductase n=1 Tax=Winogradskyella sp. SYSU M77433 TaxID=3042722 RepID=UPI0024812E5A|nr:thioredoxin-like domain-containing protein [Winogradskyella sp. SYSU M77433]MDH7912472.1 thioredoxin-like domain-containing protein [Winogradskyella sp. SYSU M77433]
MKDFLIYKYLLCSFFLASFTIGCNSKGNNSDIAYIGGEIINPKNKKITLYNTKGKVADTFTLDTNNRFLHKIENLQPGLYSIRHGGEYQMVLLEPNDSIMFRLNTYDFDGSLVFTGKGAKKNNYLIKTYLTNEKEAKKLNTYAQREPEDFDNFIEKRRLSRLNEFEAFLENNDETPFFQSIIEANINYNAYADKEIYPFAYFGNNKLVHIKDLPENFYNYRTTVDYNANHLSNFFSYNRFLFFHIDNLALKAFYDKNPFHSKFDRHSAEYNKAKLDIIDSLVEDETIKNNLLKYKARDYISYNHSEAEAQEMLDYYLEKSTDDEHKTYMNDLMASLRLLRKGNPLPDLTVVNYDDKETALSSIITKPTIIYFWTSNRKSQYRNSHYKVKELKSKFDNMDFISVNINDNDDEFWKNIIKQYDFPTTCEYKFKNSKKAQQTLALNYLNKAIIVDETGHILHPNANIYNSEFDILLSELLEEQKKHSIK